MTKEEIESFEKINRQILLGKLEKNIGISVYISDLKNILSVLKQQELEISSLKQTHNYDVEMIDEVKGKAVELYNRIKEQEKLINTLVDYIAKEDIDEEVCKHLRCVDNEEESNCRECVKKFFESKIKESEN